MFAYSIFLLCLGIGFIVVLSVSRASGRGRLFTSGVGGLKLKDWLIKAWITFWYWIVTLRDWIRGLLGKPRL